MHQRLMAVNAAGLWFRQGIMRQDSPPASMKISLPSSISSRVSRQSQKGGAEHAVLDTFTRHGAQGFVGIGFEPLVKLVKRGESERHASGRQASSGLHDSVCGGKALLAVADSMGIGVGYIAAVVTFHAMLAGGIGFLQMPLRNNYDN